MYIYIYIYVRYICGTYDDLKNIGSVRDGNPIVLHPSMHQAGMIAISINTDMHRMIAHKYQCKVAALNYRAITNAILSTAQFRPCSNHGLV